MMDEIWNRQENESTRAFEAFAAYRDLKPRSLARLAEALNKHQSKLAEWSSKHNWVSRAAAWDIYVDKHSQVAIVGAIQKMKEEQIKIALRLQSAADDSLQSLQAKLDDIENNPRAALTPDQIVKFAEAGAKLERLNRDEPDSIQQVNTTDYSKLTGDELWQLRELMVKAGDNSIA